MSRAAISLIPVRPAELAVGKAAPFAVYDWHGNLLLAAGCTIQSESQREGLIDAGFMHDPQWEPEPPPGKRPVPPERMAAEPLAAHAEKEVVTAMEDVRWQVGEVLYLQQIDNPSIRYTVRLIGFVKNQTVLITAPVLDGRIVLVRDGQTFVARAFAGKRAYAFVASAVKSVHSPHPYLHLSFPKEVRCTLVRQGARAQVKLIASVSLDRPGHMAAANLIDLSIGGASGILKNALGEKGEQGRIKFRVNVAGQDEYLNLRMMLRSVAPNEGGGHRLGFEFIELTPQARLILSAYVHQIISEGE